jgi:hypothetical protein
MAKKNKKAPKKIKKPVKSKELLNKIAWLNTLIAFSSRVVRDDGSSLDTVYRNQALRLRADLKKLKANQ